jgi:branched-subunit amino acid transport protein
MNLWLLIIVAGILTYLIRVVFILLYGKMKIPEQVQQGLRYIPAAVFAGIVFPEIFTSNQALNISLENGRMIAGLAACLVAWKTKNVILTVVVGMAILIGMNMLVGG